MDYVNLLKRSWRMVWQYRVLWVFGALLALTTVNGFYLLNDFDRDDDQWGIPVQLTETATAHLPGTGLRIDLTTPGGPTVEFLDGGRWRDVRQFEEVFGLTPWREWIPSGVRAVAIAAGIVLACILVVGGVLRYTSEAALIRMVSESEETGERRGIGHGWRTGFSRTAWRLFLVDLAIALPVKLALLLLFAVAFSPLLLWLSGSLAAGAVGTMAAVGLFFLAVCLSLVASAALSLLLQIVRRACAVEGLRAGAAIRRGVSVTRSSLKQVLWLWFIWMGTRLLWMLASVPILILISPIILLFLIAGGVIGGLPAVLIGAVLNPWLQSPFAWIVGGVVGLPILIVVASLPMLFLGGLVEVFKSSTWTLAYRELWALERTAKSPVPVEAPTPDAPGLEPAPVS
jgi:hypothetical protein